MAGVPRLTVEGKQASRTTGGFQLDSQKQVTTGTPQGSADPGLGRLRLVAFVALRLRRFLADRRPRRAGLLPPAAQSAERTAANGGALPPVGGIRGGPGRRAPAIPASPAQRRERGVQHVSRHAVRCAAGAAEPPAGPRPAPDGVHHPGAGDRRHPRGAVPDAAPGPAAHLRQSGLAAHRRGDGAHRPQGPAAARCGGTGDTGRRAGGGERGAVDGCTGSRNRTSAFERSDNRDRIAAGRRSGSRNRTDERSGNRDRIAADRRSDTRGGAAGDRCTSTPDRTARGGCTAARYLIATGGLTGTRDRTAIKWRVDSWSRGRRTNAGGSA